MMGRHPSVKTFIAVNDYYGDDVVNIKDGEHSTRRYLGGNSPNIFIKPETHAPSRRKFLSVFTNKQNKIRLQEFLQTEFSRFAREHGVRLIYCIRDMCQDHGTVPPVSSYLFYASKQKSPK